MKRSDERKARWLELRELADDENGSEFFKKYVDYLKWDGIISYERDALHRMSLLASMGLA